jgi:hypothetical protein
MVISASARVVVAPASDGEHADGDEDGGEALSIPHVSSLLL